jgi:ribosomal protein S18 acetylase RimI-like enzyme
MFPVVPGQERHESVQRVILDGEPLYVLRATTGDTGTIRAMISDAKQRLRTLGTDQWSTDWRDSHNRNRDDRIVHSVFERKTWLAVVIVSGQVVPVATVTIDESPNPLVWPEPDLAAEPAIYLNRAVTARGFSGLHIGTALIDWVAQRGGRHGARHVRIDVWTTNSGLQEYYEKRGFASCGLVPDLDYPSRARYQLPTTFFNGFGPEIVEIDAA